MSSARRMLVFTESLTGQADGGSLILQHCRLSAIEDEAVGSLAPAIKWLLLEIVSGTSVQKPLARSRDLA